MDAIKILGSLLSNNAVGSKVGGTILDTLLSGASGSNGRGSAGGILESLLGGSRRSGGGGLGALGGILVAAARAKNGGKAGGGSPALDILEVLLSSGAQKGGGSLGGLLGGGGAQRGSSGGGLGDLLGGLLGGGQPASASRQSSAGGGLADVLGGLLGGQASSSRGASSSGGGLGSILGTILSGQGGGQSGASGVLSGILGASAYNSSGSELLGQMLGAGPDQPVTPPQEAQDEAEILIEAIINAAKADGEIDASEREAILGRMGDLDADEVRFLQEQLAAPLHVAAFAKRVPADMSEQVYAFSLTAIKLDTQEEAHYFAALAQGLGIDGASANEIHRKLGQPEIFA